MKIVFKSIALKNFMSYESASLSLDRSGYILVKGINNNPVDNASSNGTGKSSLFSAISWALTGLTVNGGKEVSNIHLDGTTSVELTFQLDNNEYIITRTKNPSNLKLVMNGEDKSGKGIRDTEKILSEYLPDITHSLLNSVIILGQGLPQKFTNNSPSGRKDILEKLSNSDFMITDLKDRVTHRGDYLNTKIRSIEDDITAISAQINILSTQLKSDQIHMSNDFTTAILDSLSSEKITIESRLSKLNNELSELDNQLSTIDDTIIKINQEITDKTSIYMADKNNIATADTSTLDNEILELSAKIKSLSREIATYDNVKDICPTCGQKLSGITKIDTSDMKSNLSDLQATLSELSNQKLEISTNNKKLIADFDDKFNTSIKEIKQQLSQLQNNKKDMASSKFALNTEITNLDKKLIILTQKINSFENDKNRLMKQIEETESRISEFNNNLLYNKLNKESYEKHREINNKMRTILSRDFRGYLLMGVIEFISTQAKLYAKDIFGTDLIDFMLDGNNITITYDKKDYEVLSGGEKQKIDVIIQLAIRDMLCKFLNFSSNILILDEVTDSLDIVGAQKMFNLISTKLNDVECVYIISHHTDFEIPIDDEIIVLKGSDKISRLM